MENVSLATILEISLQQVALVWGDNDVLVEAEDLARIKDEVPNIVMNFKASYTLMLGTTSGIKTSVFFISLINKLNMCG